MTPKFLTASFLACYKTKEFAGVLRAEVPSWAPGNLFESRRLYRFNTEAKFSFPFGNAISPAAVPVRPLRPATAISTSLMISRIIFAVVKDPLIGFPILYDIFGNEQLKVFISFSCSSKHKQLARGRRGFRNARSRIPCIK